MTRPPNIDAASPGAFPLGSLESRAAARAMLEARVEATSEPLIYRAQWGGRPTEPVMEYWVPPGPGGEK
jgi:hypothetical protein